tara:strand:- start:358 stop:738 length:381 start_codon:yes stop_codon:yes gene_type:complete
MAILKKIIENYQSNDITDKCIQKQHSSIFIFKTIFRIVLVVSYFYIHYKYHPMNNDWKFWVYTLVGWMVSGIVPMVLEPLCLTNCLCKEILSIFTDNIKILIYMWIYVLPLMKKLKGGDDTSDLEM